MYVQRFPGHVGFYEWIYEAACTCMQGASPPKNVITTPSIHPQPISHYDRALADHERESPELNALANLADAAAIITETDAPSYNNPDMGNGEESHGKGM